MLEQSTRQSRRSGSQEPRRSRREFVATVGALAAGSLAGCALPPAPLTGGKPAATGPVQLSGLIPTTAWAQRR